MIVLDKVTKRIGEKVIFDNLCLKINQGDMVAITGMSGSGKTTLLNCIGQLEKIDSGHITIFGENYTYKNRRRFLKEIAGFLFQNYALMDNETVFENLKLVSKDREKIEKLLKEFGLKKEMLNKKVYHLSGGEQQRIALVRLLLKKPRLVLADEPTASLDSINGSVVIERLKQLNKEGVTVIVVTHDQSILNHFKTVIDLDDLRCSLA
ncbi:ATP-binding cassette domain-containing protein [Streptococcus plurextorum]|uniref:ATP-binding cassette domain-containing protein n=1 Tax=Streptococcus plurextorum TaxID=456876 RepID=UPI00041B03C6|nr:ATP-binding cassette domain-containing protein [Streptococcus plurextorum]